MTHELSAMCKSAYIYVLDNMLYKIARLEDLILYKGARYVMDSFFRSIIPAYVEHTLPIAIGITAIHQYRMTHMKWNVLRGSTLRVCMYETLDRR